MWSLLLWIRLDEISFGLRLHYIIHVLEVNLILLIGRISAKNLETSASILVVKFEIGIYFMGANAGFSLLLGFTFILFRLSSAVQISGS